MKIFSKKYFDLRVNQDNYLGYVILRWWDYSGFLFQPTASVTTGKRRRIKGILR